MQLWCSVLKFFFHLWFQKVGVYLSECPSMFWAECILHLLWGKFIMLVRIKSCNFPVVRCLCCSGGDNDCPLKGRFQEFLYQKRCKVSLGSDCKCVCYTGVCSVMSVYWGGASRCQNHMDVKSFSSNHVDSPCLCLEVVQDKQHHYGYNLT